MGAFPFKTAVAVALVIGLISCAHFVLPAAKAPTPQLLQSLVEFTPESTPEAPIVRHVTQPEESPPVLAKPGKRWLEDPDRALDPFYEALWRTERGEGPDVTRIVHYGDSPTTGDLITGDVRKSLQKRFGDAGPGFTLIGKPWAWYQHSGVQISDDGWQIDPASRFISLDGLFGLGGVSFTGSEGAHDQITYTGSGPTHIEVWYLVQPDGGSFEVLANGQMLGEIDTAGDSKRAGFAGWNAGAPVHELAIRVQRGKVRLYGVSAERPGPGIVYDSLGMNGASIAVMTRMFNREFWSAELQHRKPNLVIMNYGTNEADFATFVNGAYEKELREAVRRLKAAAPGASVMLMSPMDRGERTGLDEIQTMATIPKIVEIQQRVAGEMGCAYFDTYEAMGGSGTMARWYQARHRLVAADLIHPTPAGGKIVADIFVKELTLGYNRFKLRHLTGVAPRPSPAGPPQASVR